MERIADITKGNFFFYKSVGSTNREALDSIDAPDKSLFVAETQTAGRGRFGRNWEASEGGIYMTILLKPKEISKDSAVITLIAGLAVSRVIKGSLIKWPNDIILGDKKVSGILAETKISGKGGIIAVGIGINANNMEFSKDIEKKATSIYLQTGEMQDKAELICKIYAEFIEIYENADFAKIRNEYKKKCVTLGREIKIVQKGVERIMTAKDINEKGELLAEANGKSEVINFGEVSVRGLLGYV